MAQNLTYTRCGDYLIPDIRLSHTRDKTLGKYGRMRRAFLAENNPILLDGMILTETLFPHLQKETQQLAWVQHMNMLKTQAEEMVVAELIYG